MSSILLISPPEKNILMEAGDRPHMGLLYLAGAVNNTKNHRAIISDLNHDSYKTLERKINENKPEFIGITTTTPYYNWWTNFAQHLKYRHPEIKLVAGGPHATVEPEDTLQFFDYVIRGEGEISTVKLLNGEYQPKSIIEGEPVDLDTISPPDWSAIDVENYGIMQEGLKTAPILSSRSCSQNCGFCTKDILGKRQRVQSNDRTIAEVTMLKNKYGFNSFYFLDDCFTEDRARVLDLTEKLKPLNISYRATSRTDTIDAELLKAMKDSGLRSISYGLEHMNNDILRNIRKRNTAENNRRAVEIANEAGVKVRGSFILNLPGATKETMEECVDFAIQNNITFADFYPLIAYPGTPIWKRPEAFGIKSIDKDYGFFQTCGKTNVEIEGLTKDEIYKIRSDILTKWKRHKNSNVPWESK